MTAQRVQDCLILEGPSVVLVSQLTTAGLSALDGAAVHVGADSCIALRAPCGAELMPRRNYTRQRPRPSRVWMLEVVERLCAEFACETERRRGSVQR